MNCFKRLGLFGCLLGVSFGLLRSASAAEGNRLTYLDVLNPYHVSRRFPKLTTPQWVGEPGVEAVVILAIDDMRDTTKYETFLRPILNRLKQIDGRAALSIMSCKVDPRDRQLGRWLAEGLSIEVHTIDHPCPLLQGGDFDKAKSTYDRCVDLMGRIPGTRPVSFRMPCCDSLNTVSPRFYAEIFNRKTATGRFLALDTSVFNLFTAADPVLPRALVFDADGKEKFRKYIPTGLVRNGKTFNTFVNTIENSPYPYVIGNLCWEFPCLAPSDWSAQHYQGKNNPHTVADWKAALDITVLKQGVMTMVFHPHGWIRNDQMVDLIDYAARKYGSKVKFLSLRDAGHRLREYLTAGQSLRRSNGSNNGVRLLDVNNDGYIDVVIGNESVRKTRIWQPKSKSWKEGPFPTGVTAGCRFGVIDADGVATLIRWRGPDRGVWRFAGNGWTPLPGSGRMFDRMDEFLRTQNGGRPAALTDLRLRDLDGDGRCEIIASTAAGTLLFRLKPHAELERLPYTFPPGTRLVTPELTDAGLRFVDIDEDGHDDIVFSNAERYGIWLFKDNKTGWSRKVLSGTRPRTHAHGSQSVGLPPIVRQDGTDNGFFVHSRHLFWQNENTADLSDLVDRRSFDDLLKKTTPGPKTPRASLQSIVVPPGFTVDLVASEPLVKDPVAFEWGSDGRLWVVEMADYPVGIDGAGKPGGRVRYLTDSNGDGRYDTSTLFLDGIPFPNGLLPWRNGVLITAAPDIFYAEDTDGDGKADRRVTLFTGFAQGNQQHRANSLSWGLDNWVYVANGHSGGRIKSIKTGKVVDIRGRDIRIRPDTGEIDLQAGQTQFGRNRDDWGNWFGSDNSHPLFCFPLPDQYLRRNPYLAAPSSRVQVSVQPGPSPCYPLSRPLARFNDFDRLNRFTSACSAILYRGALFGPDYYGNSFVSEPVHNLIHRELVSPKGVLFTSHRASRDRRAEFLASRDNWFRPTMIKTGPDGALWIADMYRYVIEHTQYIPVAMQKGLPVRAGDDRGRIYRVYPVGAKLRPAPRFDRMSVPQRVAALDSPNGWQRDTVQRLLVNRHELAAVAPLEQLVKTSRRPFTRMQALCTLDGLRKLTPALIQRAITDPSPGVRRHAIRLSESFLNRSADLGPSLLKLTTDDNPQVQLQLAFTLGEWNDPRAADALGKLALRFANTKYRLAAVLSSVGKANIGRVLRVVTADPDKTGNGPKILNRMLSLAAAVGNPQALGTVFAAIQPRRNRVTQSDLTTLADVLDTLARRGITWETLRSQKQQEITRQLDRLQPVLATARRFVIDSKSPSSVRIAAVRLLARQADYRKQDLDRLAELLVPQTGSALQTAAVSRLGQLDNRQVPALLLSRWKTYPPAIRSRVLDVLFSRESGTLALLDAIAKKQVSAAGITALRRQQLLGHRSRKIRERAAKLLSGTVNPNRQKVLAAYASAATLRGDPLRGQKRFAKICGTCHRLNNEGHAIGPNLAALTDLSSGILLTAILDPNRAVEQKFFSYLALTTSGRQYTGILISDTGAGITLLGPKGKKQIVPRAQLEELTSTAKSLMPEGVEKDLRPQDLADIMAYIRRSAAKTPAERPERPFATDAPVRADGSMDLAANNCEIYGDTLKLEKKYQNLGYWKSRNDRAIWPLSVPRAGRYEVWAHYASPAANAGNRALFRCGTKTLKAKIPSTGSWDTYRRIKLGVIDLPEGDQRFSAQAAGPLHGPLFDLKSLRLIPATGR